MIEKATLFDHLAAFECYQPWSPLKKAISIVHLSILTIHH